MRAGEPMRGFTIIELMMVVVIVALLASVAGPSMRELVTSSRVRTASSDFYTSALSARSEAIKRRANATLEPQGEDWTSGWTVKVGGEVFVTVDALPGEISVQAGVPAGEADPIVYAMNGRVSGGAQTVLVFYSSATPAKARCVSIDPSGMPRMRTDTNGVPTDGCN